MTTLTLDVKKWRCGGDSGLEELNALQSGTDTALLNEDGYMCCLGQFARQLGAKKEDVYDKADPADINFKIPHLNFVKFGTHGSIEVSSTKFSLDAVVINDDASTTIKEKIKSLRKLCNKHKIKLIVKNGKKYE